MFTPSLVAENAVLQFDVTFPGYATTLSSGPLSVTTTGAFSFLPNGSLIVPAIPPPGAFIDFTGVFKISKLAEGAILTIGDSATLEIGPSAAVPEPASMALVGLGLAAVGVRTWRRRRS